MNTQNSMITQGAVDVPLPVTSHNGPLIGLCSGMWDGNEKGWTVVQASKKGKGKVKGKVNVKTKEREKTRAKKDRA